MSLVISEDIVQASGLSEKELVLELIILLFQRKKLVSVKHPNLLKCLYCNFKMN